MPQARYRPFGAYRFLLALLVVFQHFVNIAPGGFREAWHPFATGSVAVLAFFALSGFIVAEAAASYYRDRPGAFLVNRGLRIVPPFLAALALTVAVHYALYGTVGLPAFEVASRTYLGGEIFSLPNLAANALAILPGATATGLLAGHDFIEIAWAIRVEVFFYGVVAFGLWMLGRLPPALWQGTLVASALGFLALLVAQRQGLAPALLGSAPYFVFGVALYLALQGRRLAWAVTALALAAGLAAFWADGIAAPNLSAQLALLTVTLTAIAWLAGLDGARFKTLDRRLGDLSYPLYLNHMTVGIAFRALVPEPTAASLIAAVALSILLSTAMYAAAEPALRAVRDRVRGVSLDDTPAESRSKPASIPAAA